MCGWGLDLTSFLFHYSRLAMPFYQFPAKYCCGVCNALNCFSKCGTPKSVGPYQPNILNTPKSGRSCRMTVPFLYPMEFPWGNLPRGFHSIPRRLHGDSVLWSLLHGLLNLLLAAWREKSMEYFIQNPIECPWNPMESPWKISRVYLP